MLGLTKTGRAGAPAPAGPARSRDIYQCYAASLYRQALLNRDYSAYPRARASLWRAALRRLTSSSAAAQDGDQA